jgi:diguanylate cyclase (GGDEF)-like protein
VLWFTYVDHDVRLRVLSHTGFSAWIPAGVAVALWRSPAGPRMRYVAGAFALFAAWMAFRWALALVQAPIPSFMGAGGIHALGLIGYAVFVLLKDAGVLQDIVQRALDDMEQQARTDPLTGLLNRRALTDVATRAMAQARRRASPVSAVLVDIDHFKRINDAHGHAAGDAVLVAAARLFESQLRAGDICARLGGEEFLVLLPDTSAAQAGVVAEKLRRALEAAPASTGAPLTASFGVCSSEGLDDFGAVLQAADRALYRAKADGRNRVVQA